MILTDSGSANFEQAPQGTHRARCVKLIDIGTQKGDYQGQITLRRQVIVGWELPDELMQTGEYAGKPFTVSKFYTASLSEKATLRHDLVNWRGREFTPEELAGFSAKNILNALCMVSVTLNDKQKSKVSGVMALPKAARDGLPAQSNPSIYFSLEPDEFDQAVFDSLSDGYKKLITVSPEYQHLQQIKRGLVPSDDQQASEFDDFSDVQF